MKPTFNSNLTPVAPFPPPAPPSHPVNLGRALTDTPTARNLFVVDTWRIRHGLQRIALLASCLTLFTCLPGMALAKGGGHGSHAAHHTSTSHTHKGTITDKPVKGVPPLLARHWGH